MQIITNFLLVFALIRDTWKGHNLYKTKIFLNVVHLHPLVILTAPVSFDKLHFFSRNTKVTQPVHRPPICPPTQASKQPDPPRTHCVCVLLFSQDQFLNFWGPDTSRKQSNCRHFESLAMKLISFWTKQEVYEESETWGQCGNPTVHLQ